LLDEQQIRALVSDMCMLRQNERVVLDNVYEYMKGRRGFPKTPDSCGDEVKDLARLSMKNVLPLVRDAFVQNLCVIGYRSALAKENSPAWEVWQKNRMDGRQVEVYRPAVTYGAAYVVVTADGDGGALWRPRSPRQLLAVYEDPQTDEWPQYAYEMWIDNSDAKARRRAMIYDDRYQYPIDLGQVPASSVGMDPNTIDIAKMLGSVTVGEPIPHGATKCPVVRFVNGRDADDVIMGEIEPLLVLQRALNSVNFDSMIVSRFGAFPQKVITGWSGSSSEVLAASARRVWTFEDVDVKATTLSPADLGQYDAKLTEMLEFIATVAQVSPAKLNPKLSHVSADALAAAEANEQRKTEAKRDVFGESWEQCFRLSGQISGDAETAADDSSEVVWRDTEARSFAAVVDGIQKLAASGVPIEELIDMMPGVTQQKIRAIKDAIRRNQVNGLIQSLQAAPPPGNNPGTMPKPPVEPGVRIRDAVTK
jgi:Phage portal protein, SPP1 Gp6-like